jgi:hypothetical protein
MPADRDPATSPRLVQADLGERVHRLVRARRWQRGGGRSRRGPGPGAVPPSSINAGADHDYRRARLIVQLYTCTFTPKANDFEPLTSTAVAPCLGEALCRLVAKELLSSHLVVFCAVRVQQFLEPRDPRWLPSGLCHSKPVQKHRRCFLWPVRGKERPPETQPAEQLVVAPCITFGRGACVGTGELGARLLCRQQPRRGGGSAGGLARNASAAALRCSLGVDVKVIKC